MLHKLTALLAIICSPVFIYAQIYTQKVYQSQILRNGFDEGKLVRNHTVLYYYHLSSKLAGESKLTDGLVTVDRVVEYVVNESFHHYATYVQKDTLLSFRGVNKKGKKNGTFLSLPSGNIFYLYTYLDDELNGEYRGFYTSGQLQCEGYYHNGKQTGHYKQYYANGKLAILQQFVEDVAGLSHMTYYYAEGTLESKGSYYNEKKVNEWYYYDKQGNLLRKEYYSNKGKLIKVR